MKICATHFSMDDNSYATSYLDDVGMRKEGQEVMLGEWRTNQKLDN
jgi:hypothetical protein